MGKVEYYQCDWCKKRLDKTTFEITRPFFDGVEIKYFEDHSWLKPKKIMLCSWCYKKMLDFIGLKGKEETIDDKILDYSNEYHDNVDMQAAFLEGYKKTIELLEEGYK